MSGLSLQLFQKQNPMQSTVNDLIIHVILWFSGIFYGLKAIFLIKAYVGTLQKVVIKIIFGTKKFLESFSVFFVIYISYELLEGLHI